MILMFFDGCRPVVGIVQVVRAALNCRCGSEPSMWFYRDFQVLPNAVLLRIEQSKYISTYLLYNYLLSEILGDHQHVEFRSWRQVFVGRMSYMKRKCTVRVTSLKGFRAVARLLVIVSIEHRVLQKVFY